MEVYTPIILFDYHKKPDPVAAERPGGVTGEEKDLRVGTTYN